MLLNHSLNRTHCGVRPKARHFILGLWPHTATVRLAQTLGVFNNMPPIRRVAKRADPAQLLSAALRNRFRHGIAGLNTAIACLPLSKKDLSALKSILSAQIRQAENVGIVVSLPILEDDKSSTEIQTITEPIRTKKEIKAERDKKTRQVEDKLRIDIKEGHRKSGFTHFVRRAPGSFEGGKK